MSSVGQFVANVVAMGKTYHYQSLAQCAQVLGLQQIEKLPMALKILMENMLHHVDDGTATLEDIRALAACIDGAPSKHEIAFCPARVLMQDFTGVPAVVDLAAMRDAVLAMGGDPKLVNPACAVDLVIDHSVQVDYFGHGGVFADNVAREMARNGERYAFLKWGQQAFDNFSVVPPGTGICHQVNIEYLAQVAYVKTQSDKTWVYADTVVGTDSHTTMVNGLGVLGWGVGGIEAEAALLGQPIMMVIPQVIGVHVHGRLQEGVTATDLVLTVTERLRRHGVVGKIVEFFGPGLAQMPVAERATISNMSPEFGATSALFPIDGETLAYLSLTGRSPEQIALVEAYAKAQGLWRDVDADSAVYADVVELDLNEIVPSLAGPKRPQDRVDMSQLDQATEQALDAVKVSSKSRYPVPNQDYTLGHGDVMIAAITSCTNTSNPSVLITAGLLARNAIAAGLVTKPWVKTSLAPGSKVVMDYLHKLNLMPDLEALGYYLVGFGCTTCIGNSGPLADELSEVITENNLIVSSVLSGNRNFEGRVHPLTKMSWLASPPLVVAYGIAGTTCVDLTTEPLGISAQGKPVYLRDIWPDAKTVSDAAGVIDAKMFHKQYRDVHDGDQTWKAIAVPSGSAYEWPQTSTYIKQPPFFEDMAHASTLQPDIKGARILALLGDSVTTDHISPAGIIKPDSPAGKYLQDSGVLVEDFNSYGSRRGNFEVMVRGTFANIRLRNEMVAGIEGGVTRYYPGEETLPIYDAAMRYRDAGLSSVVVAGREYGTGSSRDWAAKGTFLLGVRAVIAESYERIHRSNLVGMGVLPLQFLPGENRETWGLKGDEQLSITGIAEMSQPGVTLEVEIVRADQSVTRHAVRSRIDTQNECRYFHNGGILHYVIRKLAME